MRVDGLNHRFSVAPPPGARWWIRRTFMVEMRSACGGSATVLGPEVATTLIKHLPPGGWPMLRPSMTWVVSSTGSMSRSARRPAASRSSGLRRRRRRVGPPPLVGLCITLRACGDPSLGPATWHQRRNDPPRDRSPARGRRPRSRWRPTAAACDWARPSGQPPRGDRARSRRRTADGNPCDAVTPCVSRPARSWR